LPTGHACVTILVRQTEIFSEDRTL
jgi:hypothetical protein